MRKICNNEWEPSNKSFERSLKQSLYFCKPEYGRMTFTALKQESPYANSDGSVSVSVTEEELTLETYWNAVTKARTTNGLSYGDSAATTNSMIMASGGLIDDGDIIDGPGNSIVGLQLNYSNNAVPNITWTSSGNSIVGLQLNYSNNAVPNGGYITWTSAPIPAPQTDTELIQGLMDRLRLMEAAVIDLSARLRGLNVELAQVGRFLVDKQTDSDTKWFLNPETEEQERPKRKFRLIAMEA